MEMLGIPKQRILRSVAKYGLTDITIDFEDGTDIYWARQQVAERLNNVLADLPEGTSGGMAPITTPLSEMFMFTVEGRSPQPGGTARPARLGDPAQAAHPARRGRRERAGRPREAPSRWCRTTRP
jgi:Cu/Ag efflux pump CusA